MDYLLALSCGALLLSWALYVVYPLLAFGRRPPVPAPNAAAGQPLLERKEQLYAAIKELEFDQELGKVASADYEHLRRELESEALELIRQLDQMNGRADLEKKIEDEIRALRHRASPSGPEGCARCGAAARAGDRFCSRCGAPLANPS
jgi:hypothetical protein